MGCFLRWFAERQRDDALRCLRTQRFDAGRPSLIAKQTLEPLLHKTFLPAANARLGLAGLTHDLVRADAIGGQQHDPGPPNVLLQRVAVFNEGLEPTSLGGRDGNGLSCAHSADSHITSEAGIPNGTRMSGMIH